MPLNVELDAKIMFCGIRAQDDAEWWSHCHKLIYCCMSFLILKLPSKCLKNFFTCDGKGAVLKSASRWVRIGVRTESYRDRL